MDKPIPDVTSESADQAVGAARLHSTDKALIRAAATGEGLVELTPEKLEEIAATLDERATYYEEEFPRLVRECPEETRLAVVCWTIRHIVDHAKEGGSYRHLIYGRMKFGPDAYMPIQMAGGIEISNDFDLSEIEKTRAELERARKELAGLEGFDVNMAVALLRDAGVKDPTVAQIALAGALLEEPTMRGCSWVDAAAFLRERLAASLGKTLTEKEIET